MVLLNEIKPKSASMRKKENKIKISPANPNSSSFFKRNVPSIIANLKEKFKQEKPIKSHIHSRPNELRCREVIICWPPLRLQI